MLKKLGPNLQNYGNYVRCIVFSLFKNKSSQGRNMRIIAIQFSKNELLLRYPDYYSSLFDPDLSDIRKNND